MNVSLKLVDFQTKEDRLYEQEEKYCAGKKEDNR